MPATKDPVQLPAFDTAAHKYGVPADILWGVYGMETGFGENIATSSAGAVGAFQFLPSTARSYAYPLTNKPNNAQFTQQLNAAAHYLSDLYKQYGSWDLALQHYSGGGYGLQQVKDKAAGRPEKATPTNLDPVDAAKGAAGAVSGAAQDVGSALSSIVGFLTNPQTWLRFVEIVLGVALLLMGLKSFTGGTVDPAGAARRMVPA